MPGSDHSSTPPEAGHNRFVSVRQRDPLTFSGDRSQDVDDWLAEFERVSVYNNWDNTIKLANVIFYLAGTARTWFENHEHHIQSWEDFCSEVSTAFAVSTDRQRLSTERLATRAQRDGEGFTSYIEDVLWLCRRSNPDMVEREKLSHLMKGVAEDAFQFLVAKSPSTVAAFCASCQAFDEARRSRLGGPVYHRLPNVAASFPSLAASNPDIRALIREIVRDELRAVLPDYFVPSNDTTSPEISLAATIKDEVRSALSGMCHLPPAEPRNEQAFGPASTSFPVSRHSDPNVVASYSEVQRPQRRGSPRPSYCCDNQAPRRPSPHRLSPGRPMTIRRTDAWRSNDYRPICFYCALPGHVYRYCNRRLRDLSFSRDRYDSYESSIRRPLSPERESSSRYTRASRTQHPSRSPSPFRRRRPPSPYPCDRTPVTVSQGN